MGHAQCRLWARQRPGGRDWHHTRSHWSVLRAAMADGHLHRTSAGPFVDSVCAASHGGDRRSHHAARALGICGAAVSRPVCHSTYRACALVRRDGDRPRRDDGSCGGGEGSFDHRSRDRCRALCLRSSRAAGGASGRKGGDDGRGASNSRWLRLPHAEGGRVRVAGRLHRRCAAC